MLRQLSHRSVVVLLAVAVLAQPAPALAGDAAPPFQAQLRSADAVGRGLVTIDRDTIEIEIRRVFSREAHVFLFGDARAVHLRRGLFHTDILLDMKDGSEVRIRTAPSAYDTLKSVLKGRITRG